MNVLNPGWDIALKGTSDKNMLYKTITSQIFLQDDNINYMIWMFMKQSDCEDCIDLKS